MVVEREPSVSRSAEGVEDYDPPDFRPKRTPQNIPMPPARKRQFSWNKYLMAQAALVPIKRRYSNLLLLPVRPVPGATHQYRLPSDRLPFASDRKLHFPIVGPTSHLLLVSILQPEAVFY
jgi:hypothetical protein